jgi:opacity protein-like surface antigen
MSNRITKIAILLLFAAATLAAQDGTAGSGTAGSSTTGSKVSIGPQLGIYKVRDVEDFNFIGGAAIRFKLAQAIGIEGSISYRSDDNSDGTVTAQSWPVMVTGLIYPFPSLYGAIGMGWYNTTFSFNPPAGYSGDPVSDETSQDFGWHFGAGVEVPLASTVQLVGDIRYVFLDYSFENVPGTEGVNSDFYVITVGLLFGL